jgi:hypothetical protein
MALQEYGMPAGLQQQGQQTIAFGLVTNCSMPSGNLLSACLHSNHTSIIV